MGVEFHIGQLFVSGKIITNNDNMRNDHTNYVPETPRPDTI